MKRILQFSALAIMLVTVHTSCKKKDPVVVEDLHTNQLELYMEPYFGSESLKLDSVYVTDEGYKVKFTDIKCFFENVRSSDGMLIDAGLFDYRERGMLVFRADGHPSNYQNLDFNIGVQSSINHADPSAFDVNSVLNIMNANDMHWGWNPGYIFFKVEAKADTIVDAIDNFDLNVVYHTGLDVNLRTKSFSNMNWIKQADYLYRSTLKLDMLNFFRGDSNPIDLKTEFTSHSTASQVVLTTKLVDNFQFAISQ
ncbi:MAG: hypothetical protein EP333_08695 [Bacteroidetes bacterium]|nr:MAG: hypothetical protein EP333_08695 [Bacteroidota bacterium]TNE98903.1 MAG: hypothetical protein EP322_04080 [Bacteroidota bacterium]